MGNLYIVATPIGNLKDITLRALEILKSADLILAEDTRVTKKLLSHYDISKLVWRFDENVKHQMFDKIRAELTKGTNIALVTDAGTPGISDPGRWLNRKIVEWFDNSKTNSTTKLFDDSTVRIIPIPGPSALSAIISASDVDLSEFIFSGFPPRKKGRQTFFKKISESEMPVIFFESPHRVEKAFLELEKNCPEGWLNVGRELTKMHEEIWRGKVQDARSHFSGERARGEFVIILSNR
ncbi:16S rRNA (cytidine(1402)-2'-O)-methyltransferase [Candidatus Giovannonibacteria bacterium]|nr:16S rRNA (cytidine(1402)-2'-O)-methyltransferase [Candidatus Giovannonibacteria bacterium]